MNDITEVDGEIAGAPLSQSWPWKASIEVDSLDDELALNAWLICEQASALGVTSLRAEFKGAWENKEALEIDHDAADEVLGKTVAIYVEVEEESAEMQLREMSLEKALETFADRFAEEHHPAYECQAGGGAELLFDLQDRSVKAQLKERHEVQGDDVEAGSSTDSLLEGLSHLELEIDFPDEGAGYSSRHRFQAINHRLLMSALKTIGVMSVNCTYSGSGDEGRLDSPEFNFGAQADEMGSVAHSSDVLRTVAQFDHRGFPSQMTIEEAVHDLMSSEVSRRHSGYEDGEGGNGEVTLDVVNAEISWTGYNTGDCEYETDVTGSVDVRGQEPPQAFALKP